MPCHLILPFQKVTLSIILYHFTTHPTSKNSNFFPFYLNILFYSFFTISLFLFIFLSFSLNLQHWFQHTEPHTETYDTLIHQSKPITTHTEPHTRTHKNTGNHSFETNFFIPEKPRQKRLRIKIHKFHFLSVLPQLSRKPNSSQRKL